MESKAAVATPVASPANTEVKADPKVASKENLASQGSKEPIAAKVEAVVAPPVKVEAEPVDPKLAEFTKREAEYVKKELKRKEEMSLLENKYKEAESKLNKLMQLEQQAKKNPLSVIKAFGLTYDEITEAVLAQESVVSGKGNEVDTLRKDIDERFKKIEESKKETEKVSLEKQKEEAVSTFKQEISGFLKTNEEKYPLTLALYDRLGQSESPESLIYNAIEAHYNNTGEVLEFDKVAETAEQWFKEEWESLNGRIKKPTPVEVKVEPIPEPKVEAKPEPKVEPIVETPAEEVDESVPYWKRNNYSYKQFKERPFTLETKKTEPMPPSPDKQFKRDKSALTKALQAMDAFERSRK